MNEMKKVPGRSQRAGTGWRALGVSALVSVVVVGMGAVAGLASASPASDIAKYTQRPNFVAPGKAFNVHSAKGKTVWIIPTTSQVPLVGQVEAATTAALKTVHVKTQLVTTTGQVPEWVTGINSAIAHKAAAIILLGISPSLVGPQLANAKKHHIPVVYTFAYQGQKVDRNVGGVVGIPYTLIAKVITEQAIADSGNKAHIAIINSGSDLPPQITMTSVIESTVAEQCPLTCSVEAVLQEPIAQWATNIQGDVQTALIAHPSINTIIPLSDTMSTWVIPALAHANATSSVKIDTVDASPAFVADIGTGTVNADMGWLNQWIGWASADQALRLMTGNRPVANEHVPAVLFNSSNIANATGDLSGFFKSPYVNGYRKLWKTK